MTISVIIPSYKPGEYIFDCLKSINNQTLSLSEYEVIVILNGCCEPYFENLEFIKKNLFYNSEHIRIIQTDNPGVSNARNIGIDVAKGEYITFVDDDDVISPTYLEGLLSVSSPTCVGCANSCAFIDSIDKCLPNFIGNGYLKCKGKPFTLYDYRAFLSPPVAKLIHKFLIGKYRFPVDLKKSEDSVFCLQMNSLKNSEHIWATKENFPHSLPKT